MTKNIGMLLLSIWMILQGLVALLGLSFASMGPVLGILALVGGIFILIGR